MLLHQKEDREARASVMYRGSSKEENNIVRAKKIRTRSGGPFPNVQDSKDDYIKRYRTYM